MEDFRTDTEPQEMEMSFKREAMARATAVYLTDELEIELFWSEETVFGQPDDGGQRIDKTTFYIRAFCTQAEMKEAAEQALVECINHDSELVKLGLLPAWENDSIVPMEDYV